MSSDIDQISSPAARATLPRASQGLDLLQATRQAAERLRHPSSAPLSIAMLGLRGVPATYGGIERHVEELGARLAARGHEITVYCRTTYTEERPDTYRGMRLRYLPSLRTKHLEAISHSAASAASTLRTRPDIVHLHAVGPGLVSPLVRAFGASAIVQTVHGLDGDRAKWGRLARATLQLGERMSARVPDETIVVSHYLAEHYRSVHDRATQVIPNGINPAHPVPLDGLADAHGLRPGSYVLFVGRLVPEKRPDLLIEAFRDLPTDKQLVIAGGDSFSSDYVRRLERMAAADPRVRLVGYVYGEQLNALYSNAAAFVMPSDLEGQGLTLLEAASHGVPVVASDIPPLVESVGRSRPGALLFRQGDADDLRAALALTLSGGDLVGRGAADLRAEVLRSYSWDAMADQVEAVYHGLASRRRR